MPLAAHDRQNPVGKFQNAKQVGFKLLPQHLPAQIFHCSRLAKCAVVKQHVQRAAGAGQHIFYGACNGTGIIQVQQQALEPLALQARHVLGLAGRSEDPVTPGPQAARHAQTDARGTACNQDRFRHHESLFICQR